MRDLRWAMLLAAASWGFGLWLFTRLPGRVPVHWNAQGRVNGWGSPVEGALLLPAIATAVLLLLALLPRIDPRRGGYPAFRGAYAALATGVVAFLALVHLLVGLQTLGAPIDLGRLITPAMGLLFAGLGLVLPHLGPNWLAGIRTPWTLEDAEVWRLTHRFAGHLFLAAGLLCALAALVAPTAWQVGILLGTIGVAVLGSVVYSYLAWRRLHPHHA
jgi:uncharacterized membrane protein